MSLPLPATLREACEAFARGLPAGEITRRAAAMSERYRAGRTSHDAVTTTADVAAYLIARLPATYAAVGAALRATSELVPSFAPTSLIDLCAGPGTASLAALAHWPQLRALALVDASPLLLEAARRLLDASELAGAAQLIHASLDAALDRLPKAELVLMSYALVELDERDIPDLALRILALADGIAIFVEPGTPEGFRRLLTVRTALLAAGAALVAPCPHALPCPMSETQWCHFAERLPRTRTHRLAKDAELAFEDEAYAYLAFARRPAEIAPEARIVSRMRVTKVEASCRLCTREGALADHAAPRRDREAYARLRRLGWGDALTGNGELPAS
jgi:ribosomal protein RSM22 (predicted rRNA methylase)